MTQPCSRRQSPRPRRIGGVFAFLTCAMASAVNAADAPPPVTPVPAPVPAAAPAVAPAPAAHPTVAVAWLTPLLEASRAAARGTPEVVDADLSRSGAQLSSRVAAAQWNPRLSLSPGYGQSRTESNSVVDGPGIIRSQSGSLSLGLGKSFATGTSLSLTTGTSASRNDGAGVISDEFYSSSVSVGISQALLRGGNRETNLSGILDAADAEQDSQDQFDSVLEGQLSDLAGRWLAMAQSEASLKQLREDVRLSSENLRQFEERLRVGLSRELDVLSLRRGVADQEVQLSKAERVYAADLRQFNLYWPGLVLPDRTTLLTVTAPTVPSQPSFAVSRQGRAILRNLTAAARRVAVARNNAYDDLSVDTSLSKYGSEGTLGGSWSEFDNRETFDLRVGLSYSHTFGTEANRIAHDQALLSLDQTKLRARVAERDWRARGLQLRDGFDDAFARVGEQDRLVAAQRAELVLATAQVEAGQVTTRDLVDAQQRVSDAVLALYQANLDVLRADLLLRLHENRLLGLLP
jgi:outer membrane protein